MTNEIERVQVTDTALILPEDMTFEEWDEYGQRLQAMSKSVMWWIGDWWRFGVRKYGTSEAKAALTGYSYQTCRMAGTVARHFELFRRLNNVPWGHHLALCSRVLSNEDQDRMLAQWAAEQTPEAQARAQAGALKRIYKRPVFETPPIDLIDTGPFNVLYADPPWRYEFSPTDSRAIENQYPTMEVAEICALNPPVLDDAVLFLWATSPKLIEAMQVVPAWGFEYRTTMVWVKDRIGMGYYVREQHELLLIARRGNLVMPEPDSRPSSVVNAARGGHSEKPEIFYKIIETMYPAMLYGELFARERRDGWGSWGNQV